ncbi:protein YibX [Escherichia coli str. K-12 substr. MG1655]|uniref:Protein YibX n=2 Tax=Enterobacteriaceae TaxID=543 RepID=YIBX_ECOLI|nr:protein YibX [Escherichia coli str. K-12 substr. MG1655] [Escherichia coli]YP_010051208.1 protein YibX [Escherichia coli str. K-12 substr. MG1655]P0DSH3.1 RecName: Full=Protein YibX [Escherichia coli K-12]QNV50549.1 protein YibX [Escherichia coli str. K-12 substr. MG1655]
MEKIPIRPFSDPASIISLCRCTLENSNAPLSLLCSATNKFILSARDSADLNEKGDFMNIFKPISYIASLAPREVTLLALV